MPDTRDLHELIQRCCRELPEGYMISIRLEKGAGWVELEDGYGEDVEVHRYHPDGDSLAMDVFNTLGVAKEHAAAAMVTKLTDAEEREAQQLHRELCEDVAAGNPWGLSGIQDDQKGGA